MTEPLRRRLTLRVRGVVQGVGFRPFVHRAASERALAGWVRNTTDGVRIEAEGDAESLAAFVERIRQGGPIGSVITAVEIDEAPLLDDAGFTILESQAGLTARAALPPDSAPCSDCLREIADAADRRGRYPFTNCTRCGPRFTITTAMPYDRERTTMRAFSLCEGCAREYTTPADRRYHAEPIACPRCGPELSAISPRGEPLATGERALREAVTALTEGKICALKGVGGYQLLADATSPEAVRRLRERKRRPDKPFAVMFPSLAALRACCDVSAAEEDALVSPSAPILLVRRRPALGAVADAMAAIAAEVAPAMGRLGAMLPSSPLHSLLLGDAARPLVCTSGNRSNEPLCIENDEAIERLGAIADIVLAHDRPIARPVDDSVARIGPTGVELLRRARGFCPLPIPRRDAEPTILALGGHLKSTIALFAGAEIVLSQHLGDLSSPLAIALHERTADELVHFFDRRPEIIACDRHPEYASTRLALALAGRFGAELVPVQHHHAHIAAVLAEHAFEGDGPVLGLAWDGIGLGEDESLWGGEALICEGARMHRFASLRPFRLPGGEAAIREGRRAAAGLLHEAFRPRFEATARAWFTPEELRIVGRMLDRGFNAPRTTSVGRLFDAVAALAGARIRATFEGQAAMELERAAEEAPDEPAYPLPLRDGDPAIADWEPLVRALLDDRARGASLSVMSARFHAALVALAVAIARRAGITTVVLGGGCFQSLVLASAIREALTAAGFTVLSASKVPSNDGGLALGQGWVAARKK